MHFTAGVYYGGQTRMNNYTLTAWMTTNSTDATDHNTAFERIKYFIYSEMDSTVFINSVHCEACQLLSAAGLKVTTMPGEPVDQLIGIMLYYKLNAITEGRMIIEETELASVMGENMTYLHSGNETTDIKNRPDWWESPDSVHCDLTLLDSDKVLTLPQANHWRELDLAWNEIQPEVDTGNTVVFADFKKSDDTE
jgi:hypothetical protein